MTYRNRQLLDLCHDAPCVLLPGQHECAGQSEPCHSDMIRHGRGEHHKSHDCFAVPGCHNAHMAFTRSNLGKDGYHAAWTEAMERYILWQWVSGKVRLADITQRPKESTMEAPMCKICEHRHYVRDPHQFGPTPRSPRRDDDMNDTVKKNTSREGRDVVKANATSTDRDHLKAQPALRPRKPGGNGTAAKPKTALKINKRKGKRR